MQHHLQSLLLINLIINTKMMFFSQKSKTQTVNGSAAVVVAGANRVKRLAQFISIITVSAVISTLVANFLNLPIEFYNYVKIGGFTVGAGIGLSLEREIENFFSYWVNLIYTDGWQVFRSFNFVVITLSAAGVITLSLFLSIEGKKQIAADQTQYIPSDFGSLSTQLIGSFGLSKDTTNTLKAEIAAINKRFDNLVSQNKKSITRLAAKVRNGSASTKEQNDYKWLSNGYLNKLERNRLKAIKAAKAAQQKQDQEKSKQTTLAASTLTSVLAEVKANDSERKAALYAQEQKINSWLSNIIFVSLGLTLLMIVVSMSTQKKTKRVVAKKAKKQKRVTTSEILDSDIIEEVKAGDLTARKKMHQQHRIEENAVKIDAEKNKDIDFYIEKTSYDNLLPSSGAKGINADTHRHTPTYDTKSTRIDYDTFVNLRKAARAAFSRGAVELADKHINKLNAAGYAVEKVGNKLAVDYFDSPSLC